MAAPLDPDGPEVIASRAHALARWALALPPLVFVLGMVVAPALALLMEGLQPSAGMGADMGTAMSAEAMTKGGLDALWAVWADPHTRWRLLWSLGQALATALAALLLGVPVAWVLARLDFVGRRWLLSALSLPMVVPTLVAALGVLALWGPQDTETPWLLLYGNLFFNLCLVVRAAVDALGQVGASTLAAARSLGASPWRCFWRIEWPLMRPWLLSALCLVFLYSFSGFGLALVLGGQRYATAEVEIYTLVAHELQIGPAAALALWTLALSGGVAWAQVALSRRLAQPRPSQTLPARRLQGLGDRLALALALAVLLFFVAAPVLAVVARLAQAGWSAWAVWTEPETLLALWNTLRFSALALVLATLLGVAHALAAQRHTWARAAAWLPLLVSPVVVALGLLVLYPGWAASLGLLVAAYALLAYPVVARNVGDALDSLPPHLLMAARSLGATPARVFWRVSLPLIRPALRRGMAWAAATAIGEFAVSLFLSRPEWATLTTLIYQRLGRPGQGQLDAALALACGLMALALLVFVCLDTRRSDADA